MRNLPEKVFLLATGISLTVFLIAMRAVILASEIKETTLPLALLKVVRGSFQDLTLVLTLYLLARGAAWLVTSPPARRRLAYLYVALCLLVLLWAAANVVVVPLLGEPITVAWVQYSDLQNSSYALEAVMYYVNFVTVSAVLGLLAGYAFITLLIAVWLKKWQAHGTPTLVRALPIVGVLLILVAASADDSTRRGKVTNPVVAFVQSAFTDADVTNDRLLQGAASSVPLRQLLPVAVPSPRPDLVPGALKNVVFFVLESTPVKYAEGFGETYPVTPNLLGASSQGRRFTGIYSHAPASNYSLISLLAAILPELSPHSMTYSYPDLKFPAIPGLLADNGFRTGFFSSSDNGFQNTEGFAELAGFQTIEDHFDWDCSYGAYETEYEYLDTANDRCASEAFRAWVEQDPGTPFFATIWTGMTHYPYFSDESDLPLVEDEYQNRYLNALRVGDQALGDLIDFLTEENLLDSTLLVIVGDHGEAFGEHGNFVHASALYEENVHVPLVFVNNTLFDGDSADTLGGLSDIAPTVLDLLGIEPPHSWQGLSLFSNERLDGVLFFAPWNGFQVGFRSGDMKYIFNANSGRAWLFDLEADPDETVNLVDTDPSRAAQARSILSAWVIEQNRATDRLLRGAGQDPVTVSAAVGHSEVILTATGTTYLSPPRVDVLLDGEMLGQIDVTNAPSNAGHDVTQEEIDGGLATYALPAEIPKCAKRLEFRFLNDAWAGEGQTGDTNLYVRSVEIGGSEYYPYRFALEDGVSGGEWGDYFVLWTEGTFWVDLYVDPDCVTKGLATQ